MDRIVRQELPAQDLLNGRAVRCAITTLSRDVLALSPLERIIQSVGATILVQLRGIAIGTGEADHRNVVIHPNDRTTTEPRSATLKPTPSFLRRATESVIELLHGNYRHRPDRSRA